MKLRQVVASQGRTVSIILSLLKRRLMDVGETPSIHFRRPPRSQSWNVAFFSGFRSCINISCTCTLAPERRVR